MEIILASTSPYRRRLLERLQIPFHALPPGVEEGRLPGEEPAAMAAGWPWPRPGQLQRITRRHL